MRVVAGDEMGLVKMVDFEKRKSRKWGRQSRERAVQRLAWAGPVGDAESLVACAYKTGGVELWDTATAQRRSIFDDGFPDAIGLEVDHGESILVASAGGSVRVLDWDTKATALDFSTGGPLSRLRCPRGRISLAATGGKEHPLQLWDVTAQRALWKAKNVKNDFLNVRVPVWIRDLAFVPDAGDGSHVVVTGTSYHQLRLYDTRAQRRPVQDWEVNELPITAVAPLPGGNEVAASDTIGTVSRVDMRTGRITGGFKGCAGAVRSLGCHRATGAIVAAGLDRYVRVWDPRSRASKHRAYLKQRLTCALVSEEEAVPASERSDESDSEEEEEEEEEEEGPATSAGVIDGRGIKPREDPNVVARREWQARMRAKKLAREAEARRRAQEGLDDEENDEEEEEEDSGDEGAASDDGSDSEGETRGSGRARLKSTSVSAAAPPAKKRRR